MSLPKSLDFDLTLGPEDIYIITNVLELVGSGDKETPPAIRPFLMQVFTSISKQDTEYSKEGFMGDAQYTISHKESEALAYAFFRVIKGVHKDQRQVYINPEGMQRLRQVYQVIEKLADQHIDILERI